MQMVKLAVVGAIGYLAYKAGQRSRAAAGALDDADDTETDMDTDADTMESGEDDGARLPPHGDPLASAAMSSDARRPRRAAKPRSPADDMEPLTGITEAQHR